MNFVGGCIRMCLITASATYQPVQNNCSSLHKCDCSLIFQVIIQCSRFFLISVGLELERGCVTKRVASPHVDWAQRGKRRSQLEPNCVHWARWNERRPLQQLDSAALHADLLPYLFHLVGGELSNAQRSGVCNALLYDQHFIAGHLRKLHLLASCISALSDLLIKWCKL